MPSSNGKGLNLNHDQLIQQHLRILKELEYKSGLFAASSKKVGTGYDKSWLRDNFYECIAFEQVGDRQTVRKTYRAILNIFLKHEYKIDHAIHQKPQHRYQYIHARYHPETFDEYWEEWGNKQHDAVGAILFKIGELEHHRRHFILKSEDDLRIVQKLVHYLESIEYWKDPDNGVWEEDEEVHASSVGACLAGLKMVDRYTDIQVRPELIRLGEQALHALLPRESQRKFVDLALLSLIYPYNIVNQQEREQILDNVEYHLQRKRGLIRYRNDHYYNRNPDGYSEEAEWTFGFSWLAIIYQLLGNKQKAEQYVQKSIQVLDESGYMPELYYSNSEQTNENTPLGWAESLFVTALFLMNERVQGKCILPPEVDSLQHIQPKRLRSGLNQPEMRV